MAAAKGGRSAHRLSGRQLYHLARQRSLPSFERCQSVLSRRREMREMSRLGEEVDLERFAGDEAYREDTVLGLALVGTAEALGTALSMAGKHGIPKWLVSLSHFKVEVASTERLTGFKLVKLRFEY